MDGYAVARELHARGKAGKARLIAVTGVGQPEDLAYLVSFLASDRAKHITGEVIKIAASKTPRFAAGATLKAAVNPKKK